MMYEGSVTIPHTIIAVNNMQNIPINQNFRNTQCQVISSLTQISLLATSHQHTKPRHSVVEQCYCISMLSDQTIQQSQHFCIHKFPLARNKIELTV